MILTIILGNHRENAKTAKSILPNFTYVRQEQFDFSLLVNGKSIERKVFPSIL